MENGSLDLQRIFGSWLVSVGYSFNLQRHYNLSYDINALPLGTYFQPSSLDSDERQQASAGYSVAHRLSRL